MLSGTVSHHPPQPPPHPRPFPSILPGPQITILSKQALFPPCLECFKVKLNVNKNQSRFITFHSPSSHIPHLTFNWRGSGCFPITTRPIPPAWPRLVGRLSPLFLSSFGPWAPFLAVPGLQWSPPCLSEAHSVSKSSCKTLARRYFLVTCTLGFPLRLEQEAQNLV